MHTIIALNVWIINDNIKKSSMNTEGFYENRRMEKTICHSAQQILRMHPI